MFVLRCAGRSLWFAALLPMLAVFAQGTREDYARAEQFLPWNISKLVFNLQLEPHWIGGTDRFWFLHASAGGREFILVDPDRGTSEAAFDHSKLAAALSRASGVSYTANNLPFTAFDFTADGRAIQFDAGGARWTCALGDGPCAKSAPPPRLPAHELLSPDGRWIAFVRDHNLFVRETATGKETPLTTDGAPFYGYATPPDEVRGAANEQATGRRPFLEAAWSPDSSKLLSYRLDQRSVGEQHLIQWAPPGGGRHRHFAWRVPVPGDADEQLPRAEYFVFDPAANARTPLQLGPVIALMPPIFRQRARWQADSRTIWIIREARGAKALTMFAADANTGAVRTVIDERAEKTMVQLNPLFYSDPLVRVTSDGSEVIWFSERDGWGHFYLYDARTGRLKNRITKGSFVVREILHVDERARQLVFTANGREAGRDPYYKHLYRVGFDGANPQLLTPEEAEHNVAASPSGRYFVDAHSTVAQPPVMTLRAADGRLLRELARTDLRALQATGWRAPERVRVRADDGATELYGVLYRPPQFDPARKYPVIEANYPGPQIAHAPRSFNQALLENNYSQALAALGFLVLNLDGRATPLRGKAMHDLVYGHMELSGYFADHIAGIRQLAARYPYLDLDRVGIWGHSGGGRAAAHSLLQHPDFYKVAVASVGSYDLRGYWAEWSEKYHGLANGENYARQAVQTLAPNLRGKLLIVHGDMDDNTHPANAFQLIDALTKANKDYDLIILPNRNHGSAKVDPYFIRRMFDYFVRHLLGVEPPKDVKLRGMLGN
ncbi:MAG: DPP IV N-terminal domain-containing protein [Blastocatellia bacterium]|nr:DPP IV N-terminal domain-containing protein [Blastocatellia bacterium]